MANRSLEELQKRYASAAAALYLILPVSAGMVLALLKGEKYAEA